MEKSYIQLMKPSKVQQFKKTYLKDDGYSSLITRYDLPPPFAYTSGDSIFRSEGQLGKTHHLFRFSKTLDYSKKSKCWNLSEDDKKMLTDIHSSLTFYKKGGTTVEYIQFFGLSTKPIIDQGIRKDISSAIRKQPCANCGTTSNIECDHKNDLKNNPRVLNLTTQTIEDFQSLCKHCNDVKRGVKAKMMTANKRIGATQLGFLIDFTEGSDILDKDDPYWYKGTYWGDCMDFKKKLSLK
jgi:hypothetical protein